MRIVTGDLGLPAKVALCRTAFRECQVTLVRQVGPVPVSSPRKRFCVLFLERRVRVCQRQTDAYTVVRRIGQEISMDIQDVAGWHV